jgi:hypothetical protein
MHKKNTKHTENNMTTANIKADTLVTLRLFRFNVVNISTRALSVVGGEDLAMIITVGDITVQVIRASRQYGWLLACLVPKDADVNLDIFADAIAKQILVMIPTLAPRIHNGEQNGASLQKAIESRNFHMEEVALTASGFMSVFNY